jgi:hypothetical protein
MKAETTVDKDKHQQDKKIVSTFILASLTVASS